MRIGIFDPYLDDIGGGEKYMMTIAETLSSSNLVSVFWDDKEDLHKIEERFSLNLSKVEVVKNIFSSKTTFFERFIASKKYDAIIFLSDGSIPVVWSKLFVHVQQPLKEFQSKSVKDRVKLDRVSAFFCNSEFTKKLIGERFGLKTHILYPPVDLHVKKLKKENIILHVGRFRVMKDRPDTSDFKKQHVMVKIFKEIIDQGLKKWKFVLAVSVQDEDMEAFLKMKKEAKDYPIEFHVNLDNASLWKFYSQAKIYWHASGYDEDVDKYPELAEHFGITTVEAMGAGAVPIVFSAGGQKEIVTDGENGLLWSSTRELKEVTLIVINSKKIFEELSKGARKRAQDFTKESFEKSLKHMIG